MSAEKEPFAASSAPEAETPKPPARPVTMGETPKPPALPVDDREASIERLLEHVPSAVTGAPPMASSAAHEPTAPALRTARVVAVNGREAEIAYRGRGRAQPFRAMLDEGVDTELVRRAMAGNEAVLVETAPDVGPVIVGVVQTRLPDVLEIKARKVVIDADEEVVMRAGRGAMRIREDGDVELVGSRISTLSRGLFRIVGRVLRLN